MQVSVENIGTLERKLTVKFPAERFETQVSARIAEMGRTVRLKGFRPGKVPTTVIKQRFGDQVRGEVLSDLIGSTLREAVAQEKLQPIANPAIDTTGRPENGEIAYTATCLERAGSVLGSGTLFKALDEALIGRKTGDTFETEIAFPEDFRNAQLAGKTAKVGFSILKVQEPKLPEIDAEFAKLFGIADGDLETFRKEVRANLERELKAALMARLKSEVAEKLSTAHAELDVPKLMVQSEARNMAAGSVPQGQQPPPQLIEAAMPIARQRVIAGLLMGEIARKQEIKIDRKRIAEQLAAIASTYEEPEKVIELYNGDPQLMSGLQNRVMEDQVAEWVAEHARTTQLDLSFDDVMRPANA